MPKAKSKKTPAVVTEDPIISYGVPRSHPSVTAAAADATPAKRKLNGLEATPSNIPPEPSLGDRLQKDLGAAAAEENILDPGPPKADNLSILLEQGLKSADNSLLQSVLSRCDEGLIRKTIELLPLQLTVPLIQHLGKVCAEERPRQNRAPLLWLSNVLTIRSSYLTTLPNLEEALRNVYVHGDRRIRHTDRFVRLAGTISASVNLVKQRLHQKAAANSGRSEVLSYNEPLDESESGDDDDTGDTDEEMPSDEDTDGDESYDEDEDKLKRKKPSKVFNASDDEESEPEVSRSGKRNGHTEDLESEEED
ncbi:putative WD repeat-containing protein 43 [Hypsibius exemplaris]|uniref:WD repeat-containing protein 43 n=1 Tax=Hypsibius exemplaris TaxID=2072580 RepID=A0A9X6NN54_HYPEX|nr:putative WD repeat-containing protein 43 [Hypsibius exemplaris]